MLRVSSADARTSLCVKGEQAHPVTSLMSHGIALQPTILEIPRDDAGCDPVPCCPAQI